ncbi:MAG: hypothetical protein IH840_18390 [Candidatus Heimdallarchaeota archaeon]|nr:hypothetical protein [Candidatus Heimdallarchaeota archaeon]
MPKKILLGILSDPAKSNLYEQDFFSILKTYQQDFIFHLIGASERDVTKKQYQEMYSRFHNNLKDLKFTSVFQGHRLKNKHFSSRVGLFPASINHLIKGPQFIFGPYPINSQSRYLKFKSKVSINLVRPFISGKIFKIGYCPFGGKAFDRTRAFPDMTDNDIYKLFYKAQKNSWFDFFYLEAGSGESNLRQNQIQSFLSGLQDSAGAKTGDSRSNTSKLTGNLVIPRSIYGGGITNVEALCDILRCNQVEGLIPETIIIGNISEKDVRTTFQIIEKVSELNE